MNTGHQTTPAVAGAKRSWRLTRGRAMLCLVVLAVVSHPWWLRAFGEFLVAERPLPPADVAIVLGGDHRLQRAAALFDERAVSEIWLLERRASYAVSVGILPPKDAVETEQLRQRGIPDGKIRVLSGSMRDVDDAARMIARALRDSPETRAIVLCDRLNGRNVRMVFASVPGQPLVSRGVDSRVGVLGMPNDRFDEGDWWKSRAGWKGVFNSACQLVFTMVRGADAKREPFAWDADDYERRFVSTHGEAGCHASE